MYFLCFLGASNKFILMISLPSISYTLLSILVKMFPDFYTQKIGLPSALRQLTHRCALSIDLDSQLNNLRSKFLSVVFIASFAAMKVALCLSQGKNKTLLPKYFILA